MKPHPMLLSRIPPDTSGAFLKETNELSFILRPSPHDGVGVFCTHGIQKGTKLRLFPGPEQRFVPHEKPGTNTLLEKFCRWYGLEDSRGFHVPHDFGCMEIGWYLNHSGSPNAYHEENYDYVASRDIRAGEEITIDYETLKC
jgi:hypothetical protein